MEYLLLAFDEGVVDITDDSEGEEEDDDINGR